MSLKIKTLKALMSGLTDPLCPATLMFGTDASADVGRKLHCLYKFGMVVIDFCMTHFENQPIRG